VSDEPQPPDLRASDAERDTTIERLRVAAGEGRLTLEELTDRIEAAGHARTRAELDTLLRDLPATTTDRPPVPGAPVQQTSVFGDLRRSGQWLVPARGSWRTIFGDVVLDLREARIPAAELQLRASSVFGDIDVLVPEGVEVEARTRTVFGDVRQEAGDAHAPGAPRIVLTGGSVFGDVKVRHQRLRERLVERWRER
jgi:hypothetical protein